MGPSIALWGDSIGRGVVFDKARGRYAVAKTTYAGLLKDRDILDIDNHARFGATAQDGLNDFEKTPDILADTVVLAFGGNDCNLDWRAVAEHPDSPHQPKVSIPDFTDTLTRFALMVKERGKKPLLVTPPPLIAKRFFAWVSQGLDSDKILQSIIDVNNIYHWQERYALAVHRVAKALDLPLFDLRDCFLACPDMAACYCEDGMHPNDKGQALIAQAIADALPGFIVKQVDRT